MSGFPLLKVIPIEAGPLERTLCLTYGSGEPLLFRSILRAWTYEEWDRLHPAERPRSAFNYPPFGMFELSRPNSEEAWDKAKDEERFFQASLEYAKYVARRKPKRRKKDEAG